MALKFDYLIVGGGMTADAAAKGIRELDEEGSIGIVSDDQDPPYTRPALSKKLWTDPDFTPEDNWLGTAKATGANIMNNTPVVFIEPDEYYVVTDEGDRIGYGRLLLATGGVPVKLDVPASDRSIYFRSFADYRALRRLSGEGREIAVVGGSFIGTELAAALVQNDTRPVLIYPEGMLGGAMFPKSLTRYFGQVYESHGVELLAGVSIKSGTVTEDDVMLELSDGSQRRFDAMVSGLGITPCTALAEEAGLQVDNGIVVDERLRTSAQYIYAAGDVACYPDHLLGRRRIEHVNNATQMGATVGRIMAGSDETYDHTPYFYSHVFDLSWQAIGTLDASLDTVEDWYEPFSSGVIYYLDGKTVVGVLLWNREEEGLLDAAREVLADSSPQDASTLKGRI